MICFCGLFRMLIKEKEIDGLKALFSSFSGISIPRSVASFCNSTFSWSKVWAASLSFRPPCPADQKWSAVGGSNGWLVLSEALLVGLVGGALGVGLAIGFLHWQSLTLGNEGLTLAFVPDPSLLMQGIIVALILGLVSGLYPAWIATRQSIVTSLRDR